MSGKADWRTSAVVVGGLPAPARKDDRLKLKVELVPRRGKDGLEWAIDEDETRMMLPQDVRDQDERRKILSKAKPTKAELRRAAEIEKRSGARYSEWCAGNRTDARAMAAIRKAASNLAKSGDEQASALGSVVEALAGAYDAKGVALWLENPRSELDGMTPARAIMAGDVDKVLKLAMALRGPGGAT